MNGLYLQMKVNMHYYVMLVDLGDVWGTLFMSKFRNLHEHALLVCIVKSIHFIAYAFNSTTVKTPRGALALFVVLTVLRFRCCVTGGRGGGGGAAKSLSRYAHSAADWLRQRRKQIRLFHG